LSLDPYLNGLKGAKGNISNQFSRCRSSKVDQSFVLGCILRTSNIRVVFFEELVEPEFASTLSTVTKQGRHPTPEETFHPLLPEKNSKTRPDALVLCRVNLIRQMLLGEDNFCQIRSKAEKQMVFEIYKNFGH
jgi:hypothetical protein